MHRNFLRKKYSFVKFLIFCINLAHWAKKTFGLFRKVFVRFVTTASHMSTGIFEGRIPLCKTFSFSFRFRTLSETFLTFSRIFFVGFVTTASDMSLGLTGERLKNFAFFLWFFDIERKCFDLLSKSFRRVCQNCNLHVLTNFWRKNKFL